MKVLKKLLDPGGGGGMVLGRAAPVVLGQQEQMLTAKHQSNCEDREAPVPARSWSTSASSHGEQGDAAAEAVITSPGTAGAWNNGGSQHKQQGKL